MIRSLTSWQPPLSLIWWRQLIWDANHSRAGALLILRTDLTSMASTFTYRLGGMIVTLSVVSSSLKVLGQCTRASQSRRLSLVLILGLKGRQLIWSLLTLKNSKVSLKNLLSGEIGLSLFRTRKRLALPHKIKDRRCCSRTRTKRIKHLRAIALTCRRGSNELRV